MENFNSISSPNNCCCHCKDTTQRSQDETQALVNRLSRIEGQIRGIRNMLQQQAYCIDILTQTSAVSAALSAFNKELLAYHMRNCVTDDIRSGNDELMEELIKTLKNLMR